MIEENDNILQNDEELTEDENGQLYEHLRMEVDKGQVPLRIDKFMCEHLQHTSRNRIQKAADAGFVHVNDKPVKSNYKVRPLDVITLMPPAIRQQYRARRNTAKHRIRRLRANGDKQTGRNGGASRMWQLSRYAR